MRELNYNKLTGDVVLQSHEDYKEHILAWNRAIEKSPLVIVYCHNTVDVSNAIKWSKENSIPFKIRSGRHHYEGFSTGDGVLVIDVSKMNKIFLDKDKNIAKIEGGVRNRELYEALNSNNYPFPGGGCPTVGAAGYTLGGGWGYSARFFGLGCDYLIEAEIVDGQGNIIIANEKINSDLLWALKGAGAGNFGVVTSITFKLLDKIENGTLVSIEYKNTTEEEMISIFDMVQKNLKKLDRRLNIKIAFYNSKIKGIGALVTGIFYGSKEEAEEVLAPFKNLSKEINFDLKYMSVFDINKKIQDDHPDYEKYKSTGRFIDREYNKDEIRTILDILDEIAEGSEYTALTLYGLGGAVKNKAKDETAFYYRDADFILGMQSVWEDSEYANENKKWIVDKFKIIKEMTIGSFIAFPIAELESYETEYYGENISKLREIKKKYDPNNIFKFEQSIKID